MLSYFLFLAHTTELSPQSPNDQTTFVIQMQTDEPPITFVDPLIKLQTKERYLRWLQTASTITDYTCQFTQVALTIPQLAFSPSENTGVWLNSFNLAAGIIAISQIPTKKWIQSHLEKTRQAIAQL